MASVFPVRRGYIVTNKTKLAMKPRKIQVLFKPWQSYSIVLSYTSLFK